MLNTNSKILFDYWNRLRQNRIAPSRFEIMPSDIGHLLPDTFILEKTGPRHMRFRLAGSRLSDMYGKLLKGVHFHSIWADNNQSLIGDILQKTMEHGTITTLDLKTTARCETPLELQLLILPLSHSNDLLERAVGTIQFKEKPTRFIRFPIDTPLISCIHQTQFINAGEQTILEMPGQTNPQLENSKVFMIKDRKFHLVEGGK